MFFSIASKERIAVFLKRLPGLLAFLGPFLLYLHTMAPTVYGLDSAELATGAYTLGIIHSPGSPLFLMVGRLFCFLPFGDVGWRVNLVSVFAGSLASYFLYSAMFLITGKKWIGLSTAWLLSFSYYIWVWSVVAELYASHLCIVAALLWFTLKSIEIRNQKYLMAAGLLAGAGMGNHTSLVLAGPGLAWLLLSNMPDLIFKPFKLLAPAVLAFLSAIIVFLYLPLRHISMPAVDFVRDYFPEIDLLTLKGWIWMIKGGMFESLFFSVTQEKFCANVSRMSAQILANFGIIPLAIALAGVGFSFFATRFQRNFLISLLLMFVFHSGFYLTYGALDSDWMHSVSYFVLACLFGLGLDSISKKMRSEFLLKTLAFLLVAKLIWFNFPYVDLSNDRTARLTGEKIMEVMEPDSLFIGMWEHLPILEYLQIVEGIRKDVKLVNGVFVGPAGSSRLAADAHARGIAVYTTATNLFDKSFSVELIPNHFCYRVMPPKDQPIENRADEIHN